MKKHPQSSCNSAVRQASLLFSALIIALCFNPVEAQKKRGTGTATGAIDEKTFKALSKAQELAETSEYDAAIQVLDKINNSGRLNGYAKSQMWNLYAYIYASQERYQDAIHAYKQILAEADAPDGLKLSAKYTLAQLHFQLEDYPSVISLMEEWLQQIPKPTATAHIILAQCYYQSELYAPALKNLNQAIEIEEAEKKPPRENWLQMKAAIYFAQKDNKNLLKTYKELLRHFPSTAYLRQLAELHGELGQARKRLTTYDAIYLDGRLTKESELLNLAYMYLGQELSYQAGKVIETGIQQGRIEGTPKNTELLANAWAQANEYQKAIPALKKAASLSDKGILYARLAGVYFDAGNFEAAAEAAKKADGKGGLKNKNNNRMLMGIALFNIKRFEDALQAFRQAKSSGDSDARKWEKHTLSELKRLQDFEKTKLKLVESTKETLAADKNKAETIGANSPPETETTEKPNSAKGR